MFEPGGKSVRCQKTARTTFESMHKSAAVKRSRRAQVRPLSRDKTEMGCGMKYPWSEILYFYG